MPTRSATARKRTTSATRRKKTVTETKFKFISISACEQRRPLSYAFSNENEIKKNERLFTFEVLAHAGLKKRQDEKRSIMHAVGVRVNFATNDLDSKFKIGFSSIGAAARLGIARFSYRIEALGLADYAAFSASFGEIGENGYVTPENFDSICKSVLMATIKVLNDPSGIEPKPLSIDHQPRHFDRNANLASIFYGVRQIRLGVPLGVALANKLDVLDATIISDTYKKFGAIPEDSAGNPSSESRSMAERWLTPPKDGRWNDRELPD